MADWVQKMKDTMQPHVPEPVVSVGILQPAGSWGAMGAGMLSGFGGMLKQRKADQAAGGLAKVGGLGNTKMALFALTEQRLYAFSGKPRGTKWKVNEELGSWSRDDLRITTERGRVSTKVGMEVISTGERYELEATRALQRSNFTDEFLAELTGA